MPDDPYQGALAIGSFAELIEREGEILERIADIPNGEHLFLIHPFMMLADAGVELSDQARAEILDREPSLSALSSIPYEELRRSQEPQSIHYQLDGLFSREEQ